MTWEINVSPLVVVAVALVAYVLAYRVYARHLSTRLFELDGSRPTPAHTLSAWPVILAPAGVHRNSAILAMSRAVTIFFIATFSRLRVRIAS